MWHKAKKVSLTAGQTDIKIEFPLPIVACNLMIEYADYYENIQVLFRLLQQLSCPRRENVVKSTHFFSIFYQPW